MLIDARYSVYRRSDGLPVFIHGTRVQCAKAMGIQMKSFDSYASRDRHNKPKRIRKWIIVQEKGCKRKCGNPHDSEKDAGKEPAPNDIHKEETIK